MLEMEPMGGALKALPGRMQMTVPAASLMVDTMVSKGLIERTPPPNDWRAVCQCLTHQRTTLFNDEYSHFHREIDRRAQILNPEELKTLENIVKKLRHA